MRYENQTFKDQALVLDGNEYIGCTFENCTMVYSASGEGGQISPLDGKGVQIHYEGAARAAIDMHEQILFAGVAITPPGAYLRLGSSWFQRVNVPVNVGAEAAQTKGLAVVIP